MTGKQKRPGGRTEQNRQAVAAAVLDLIGKCNLDFEVQEVACRRPSHYTISPLAGSRLIDCRSPSRACLAPVS